MSATLSWSATDPDNDPLTYELRFGTANPPPQVVASQSAATYAPPGDLAFSTTYYWQVIADDGRGGTTPGPVWEFTTTAPPNQPPNAPTNPNPANAATSVPISAAVSWSATDPDNDILTYEVRFGTTSPPAQVVASQSSTTYDPPGDLAHSTTYYWQVVANDGHGGVTPGAVWSFVTAAPPNQPPNAPANPSPANAATNVALTASLSWSGSDPENDPLNYEVRFGTANPPPTALANQSGTTYDPPGSLTAHTIYYWQIVAKDADHPSGTAGPVWSFTTANAAPTAPGGPNPANGATNVPTNTQVCWTASTDADGDAVTYDVAFGATNPPSSATAGQSATCYDPPGNLTANTPYYWKVTAKDSFGGATAGPVWSFTTAGGGAFPDVFYVSPATNGTVAGITYTGSDILRYTKSTNAWAMFFDGSDVSVTKNVSAFAMLPDGDILLSFAANQALSGLGTFAAHDVARFHPTQTGDTTGGTFAWYFDGSDVGLSTTAEKIDALDTLADGRLLISATGAVAVPGLAKQQDEDVLAFTPTATGQTTSGTWAAYFNGTAVPGLGVEDMNAFWVDETTGDRYLTIVGTFNLSGVTGNDKSIVKLLAGSNTPSLVPWTTPPFNVDGLELVR